MNARQAAALAKIDAALDASDLAGRDGSKRIPESVAAKIAGAKTLEALLRRGVLRLTYSSPVADAARDRVLFSDVAHDVAFYVEKGDLATRVREGDNYKSYARSLRGLDAKKRARLLDIFVSDVVFEIEEIEKGANR